MTDVQELEAKLGDADIVQVAGVDVDGVLRGKLMQRAKLLSAVKSGGFGFCSVVFGWDIQDQPYTNELAISNLGNGYKDLLARVDVDTLRWTRATESKKVPFMLVTFLDADSRDTLCACPRGTLQRVVEQIQAHGYQPFAGAEYEYFQYRETPESLAAKDFVKPQPLTPGMHGYSLLRPALNREYFHAVHDRAKEFGIDIEGHHTETGPGVYETALAYREVRRMADDATLFKFIAKTVGMEHGVMPTFMAKPYGDMPGCSGHVHVSLQDKSGSNVFAVAEEHVKDGRPDAAFPDTSRISKLAEHFLAGVLQGLPDTMPCLLPNVNSYKRLVESYWAPTTVSYAYENRVASVRIISPPSSDRKGTRLEVRVPGADMNPHLTFAAVFACGLYGMQHSLPLTQAPIDTSKPSADPLRDFKKLPKTLFEATQRMKAPDSMARKVLGDAFVDHYAGTRENEWNLFAQAVTDWEVKRYTELV